MESDPSPYAGTIAVSISLACTVVAIMISSWHITMHLRNYTEPTYQRYIVRIIFMVPVSAPGSFYLQTRKRPRKLRDLFELHSQQCSRFVLCSTWQGSGSCWL